MIIIIKTFHISAQEASEKRRENINRQYVCRRLLCGRANEGMSNIKTTKSPNQLKLVEPKEASAFKSLGDCRDVDRGFYGQRINLNPMLNKRNLKLRKTTNHNVKLMLEKLLLVTIKFVAFERNSKTRFSLFSDVDTLATFFLTLDSSSLKLKLSLLFSCFPQQRRRRNDNNSNALKAIYITEAAYLFN